MKSLGVGVGGVFLCRAPEPNRHLKSSFPRGFIYSPLEIDVAVPVLSLTILARVGIDSDTCSGELGFRLVWGMEARGVPQVFSLSEKEGLWTPVDRAPSLPAFRNISHLLQLFTDFSKKQSVAAFSEVVLSVVSWPPFRAFLPKPECVCLSAPKSSIPCRPLHSCC